MKLFYLVAIIFCAYLPTVLYAQEETSLRINEVMLSPYEDDLPWVELYSEDENPIDLTGWYFENEKEDVFELTYTISSQQYLIIHLLIEEDLIFTFDEELRLIDSDGTIIDEWIIEETETGMSIIYDEENIIPSYSSTPGRPNILEEAFMCERQDSEKEQDQETESETNQTTQPLESGAVIINEVFANPLGDETEGEFIELYNTENRSINLEQWIIADASKEYVIEPVIILPHDYLVLKRTTTSIALNNGSEIVTLSNPFNATIHELAYEKANEGKSWNYQAIDSWYEQFPTPGGENLEPESQESEEAEDQDSDPDQEIEEEEEENEIRLDSHLGAVVLNELMPNPVGSDTEEWIELYNPTSFTIELAGLIIADTSKQFTFEEGLIPPRSYFLVERSLSSIALNNSNETLSLIVDDLETDSFSYEESEEGIAWARFDDEWEQTNRPTPDKQNEEHESESDQEIDLELDQDAETDNDVIASSTKKSPSKQVTQEITLDDWGEIDEGEKVIVSGVITALPGTFQKRTAILQNEDTSSPIGIELYFHKAEWPDLALGDIVSITGEKSITQNGDRLLIREQEAIKVTGSNALEPLDFDQAEQNILAKIEGRLIEQTKKELLIDVNGDEFIVTPPEGLETIEPNTLVTITGITKMKKEEKTLIPRSIDDIHYEKPATLKPDQPETTPIPQINQEKPEPLNFPIAWMGLSSSVTAVGVLGGVYRKRVMEVIERIRESSK